MPSKVSVFTDRYQYKAAIRAADLKAVPTVRGVSAPNSRASTSGAYGCSVSPKACPQSNIPPWNPRRAPVVFLTEPNQPAIHHEGVDVSQDDIVIYGSGVSIHHRTSAGCRFGSMSLSPDDLAATARVFTGRNNFATADTYCIRPNPRHLARLRQLLRLRATLH